MSGSEIWAYSIPSFVRTIEWIRLWGCTRTFILSAEKLKSLLASITSSPLFAKDAESIVIFLPMFQVGCFNASSRVTDSSCSFVWFLKGPPLAVIINSEIFSVLIWFIRLKIAECSESTGIIFAFLEFASFFISGHAITTVSLFASAKSTPASSTILEGNNPAEPAIPFTTMSGFVSLISFSREASLSDVKT